MLYLTELLQDCLEYQAAQGGGRSAWPSPTPGSATSCAASSARTWTDLGPEQLAQVLIAGLTPEELKLGHGVVFELLDRHDFVLDPLPNLVFTRDSSFWIGDQLAVASLAADRRRREAGLASVIYRHHPRFDGVSWLYQPDLEHLDGGDVLLLSPGVLAIGVGERTTAAGAGAPGPACFRGRPGARRPRRADEPAGGAGHLDTVCACHRR